MLRGVMWESSARKATLLPLGSARKAGTLCAGQGQDAAGLLGLCFAQGQQWESRSRGGCVGLWEVLPWVQHLSTADPASCSGSPVPVLAVAPACTGARSPCSTAAATCCDPHPAPLPPAAPSGKGLWLLCWAAAQLLMRALHVRVCMCVCVRGVCACVSRGAPPPRAARRPESNKRIGIIIAIIK